MISEDRPTSCDHNTIRDGEYIILKLQTWVHDTPSEFTKVNPDFAPALVLRQAGIFLS